MSGICGICQPGRPVNPATLEPMIAGLVAGLPEESEYQNTLADSAVLAVAQRWAFQQVAALADAHVAVDAELFNQQELVRLLKNHSFYPAQTSLAELLARLYLERGVGFLELLDGVFSLALWDEKAQRLVLAIDRLGVRSLYWGVEAGRFLFASRPGAIRAVQNEPAEVNPVAVMQYLLFSVVPAPLAIYQGIEKLRPGHLLIYENGQIRQQQYWDLNYSEGPDLGVREWAERVREALRSSVHRHLEGLAPERSGAYLSGGTDSSSVVAFMNERHSPVKTFSIFFAESLYSEIAFARTTADHFRTRHHERSLTPQDAYEAIPKITQYYDEPFANSSAIGAYYCARLARESGVDTLLAGDGGDELFAGNQRYTQDKYLSVYNSMPALIREALIEPLVGLLPQNDGWLSLPSRYVRRAHIPNPRRFFSYGFFLSTDPKEIFEPDFLAQVPPETWLEIVGAHFHAARARSELNRLLYLDVKLALADNDLRKVAGTAELAGIRVRFPLLDHRLAELSGHVPPALKLKGFKKRYVFKQAMKGILPHKVLYKKKHGFGVPLGHWLVQDDRLNEVMRDLLLSHTTTRRGYFRPHFVETLIQYYLPQHPGFYGEIVWFLMVLELWHREHGDRSRSSVAVD